MPAYLANPLTEEQFFGPQPAKFGAIASPEMQVSFWYLEPGQSMVFQKNNASEQLYVGLSGWGELTYFDGIVDIEGGYVPSPVEKVVPPSHAVIPEGATQASISLQPGSVVAVSQNTYHSVVAGNGARMVLLGITVPEGTSGTFLPR